MEEVTQFYTEFKTSILKLC